MGAIRQWDNIFKELNKKNCQTKILYLTKLSLKKKDEINQIKESERICCLTRKTKGSPSS